MVKKLLKILNNEISGLNQAALLLAFFALLSQVLGLLRDRTLAHVVGPSASLDAYYAAFRLPDFLFVAISSLVSITAILPFVIEKMGKDKDESGNAPKFISDIFTVFFAAMAAVSLIAFFMIPEAMLLIAPCFAPEIRVKAVEMSRIMLLSPLLLGLSNLFGTITQMNRKFFIYSLSPVLYNLGIIFGAVFLYPRFGITGVAIGVVVGASLHFLIQAISSGISGFPIQFSKKIDFGNIKRVVLVSLPRTLGLALNNIAFLAIMSFASFFSTGSVSIFNLSFNLQSVPLGIIGMSYSTAAFPTLARFFSFKDNDGFKGHLKTASRQIIFWSLPITFLFIVLRAQIVRVILGSGSFSWDNTRLVAAALAVFSVSVLAQSLIALFVRAYYASGDTRKPLVINLISSIIIVLLVPVFSFVFNHFSMFRYFMESILKVEGIKGTEILMLPLAYSIGTILNFILLWISIKRDFIQKEQFIKKSFFQSLGASFFIGLASYESLKIFSGVFGTTTFWGVFLQGLCSGLVGVLAGVAILILMKNDEIKELISALRSKFWKASIIAQGEEKL